jgi:hypothetical protein
MPLGEPRAWLGHPSGETGPEGGNKVAGFCVDSFAER